MAEKNELKAGKYFVSTGAKEVGRIACVSIVYDSVCVMVLEVSMLQDQCCSVVV